MCMSSILINNFCGLKTFSLHITFIIIFILVPQTITNKFIFYKNLNNLKENMQYGKDQRSS